jgi:hypothetical protein
MRAALMAGVACLSLSLSACFDSSNNSPAPGADAEEPLDAGSVPEAGSVPDATIGGDASIVDTGAP